MRRKDRSCRVSAWPAFATWWRFLKYDTTERNPLARRAAASRCSIARSALARRKAAAACGTSCTTASTPTSRAGSVFDGVMPHVAGGGLGSFNHRFASPTRTNGQHEEHTFPADYFPFTYGDEKDPVSRGRDRTASCAAARRLEAPSQGDAHAVVERILAPRPGRSSTPIRWARATPRMPPEVRIYTFGGTQHGSRKRRCPGQRAAASCHRTRPITGRCCGPCFWRWMPG